MAEETKPGRLAITLRWCLAGFSAGAGIRLALAAIQTVEGRPQVVAQLLISGLLPFAALFIGAVVFGKRLDRFGLLQERNVVAQERLAENLGMLAGKDDKRAQEQDILLGFLARNSVATLKAINEVRSEIRAGAPK